MKAPSWTLYTPWEELVGVLAFMDPMAWRAPDSRVDDLPRDDEGVGLLKLDLILCLLSNSHDWKRCTLEPLLTWEILSE
ncbi:hypothetical protein CI610_03433 [invertebrate metagenome]|uniref:Uncharacterized protein n=1 Tax=invertebrate metagenome TaxID=1711999 RepID=A0A2H9T368_9ZZZZ